MLSRYLSPVVEPVPLVVEIVCLSRYLRPVVEIVCCPVISDPSSRDRVLSRYLSPIVEILCCPVISAQ